MNAPLISPTDLAGILVDPDLVVLDIRSVVDGGGRAAYEAGHVPGAIHSDYVAGGWRVKAASGGAGMLPSQAELSALLASLGIRPESRVVVAGSGTSAGDLAASSRVYWTLKAAGHERMSLLDGGTRAWAAAGQPLEAGENPPHPVEPYPVQPNHAIRATLPEVERAVAERSAHLVDTRNRRSFVGEEKSPAAARAGRLPGALQQDNVVAFDPATGRLRGDSELCTLFALPEGEVVAYCNTGQQAATNWFVLSEILGRPDVRLYDGSLSEWTAAPERPVVTGE